MLLFEISNIRLHLGTLYIIHLWKRFWRIHHLWVKHWMWQFSRSSFNESVIECEIGLHFRIDESGGNIQKIQFNSISRNDEGTYYTVVKNVAKPEASKSPEVIVKVSCELTLYSMVRTLETCRASHVTKNLKYPCAEFTAVMDYLEHILKVVRR